MADFSIFHWKMLHDFRVEAELSLWQSETNTSDIIDFLHATGITLESPVYVDV